MVLFKDRFIEIQFTDHTIHPLKAYNSGFQYIHRYGQPSPQPITEHFHSLKNKPCALFSQPLTSVNPLAQGEHEPSFCLGSGTGRASFGVRRHSGAQWGAVGRGAGLRASAPGNSAQAAGKTRQDQACRSRCPRTTAEPPPQGGGRRRNRPQLTSARAQNAASATGSWRGWRKAASLLFLGRQPPELGERGPVLRGGHALEGVPTLLSGSPEVQSQSRWSKSVSSELALLGDSGENPFPCPSGDHPCP